MYTYHQHSDAGPEEGFGSSSKSDALIPISNKHSIKASSAHNVQLPFLHSPGPPGQGWHYPILYQLAIMKVPHRCPTGQYIGAILDLSWPLILLVPFQQLRCLTGTLIFSSQFESGKPSAYARIINTSCTRLHVFYLPALKLQRAREGKQPSRVVLAKMHVQPNCV